MHEKLYVEVIQQLDNSITHLVNNLFSLFCEQDHYITLFSGLVSPIPSAPNSTGTSLPKLKQLKENRKIER